MFHKLLQCPEWRPSGDEKSTLVQLSGGNENLLEIVGPVSTYSTVQSEISPSKIVSVGHCRLTVCYNIASYVWETKRNVLENSQKLTVYQVMWQFLWLIKFGFSPTARQPQHPPYSVMFDSVSISDREREVVPPRLRVSDQERSVLILTKQELLLSFESLDLSEIPPERQNKITYY